MIIEDIVFDSNDTCLIDCEKYSKDISMRDSEWNSFELDNKTKNHLINEIRILNEKGEGDQAIFTLKLKK